MRRGISNASLSLDARTSSSSLRLPCPGAVAAKKPYLEELRHGQGDGPEDKRYGNFLALMSDPLPYGIAANRPSIEALVTYSLQQKLIPSRPQLDRVFVDIDP